MQRHLRCQWKGETVDDFITDLYCLAESCAYGNLHSKILRDRIVVGLLDDGLSEKMQLDPNLTSRKQCLWPTKTREFISNMGL